MVRNFDVLHPFRQDTAFWYLTGFHERTQFAVLAPGHDDGDYTLFVRPKDPDQEVLGPGSAPVVEGAKSTFGADEAHPVSDFDNVLARMMVGRESIWYAAGNDTFERAHQRHHHQGEGP